ncbi:hypothetical protein GCM10011369_08950 [Neiella marina]|uniref:Uncharacterized protein n=1 Tax=Neiella marina TaxID=508461 RepID=A0A8J2U368_9GAMM|nr:hypothetical protein [Neiella marina]GGA69535.1 hypothetical protein GCM10011369_08950 [Neiella marina]
MKRIQIALISGLTLASTAFVPAASANDLSDTVAEVAVEVAEQVAADIKESSVRQLEQVWAGLQGMVETDEAGE